MNILQSNEEMEKLIWEFIKNMRRNIILETKDFYHSRMFSSNYCQENNTILVNDMILQNINNIENKLDINSSENIFDNVTDKTFSTAARMFTYLNHCPPKVVFFYQDLFRKSSLKDIILNSHQNTTTMMNRIMTMRLLWILMMGFACFTRDG